MFKYNNNSRIQTATQTATQSGSQNQSSTFTGTPNTLGGSNNMGIFGNTSQDDEIMFAIVTGNLTLVKRLINSTNVNNIIDRKNGYTALHHAVRIKKNDQVIEYLLSVGANPSIKSGEQKDSVDLAIESNYRFLIDKMMKDKDIELLQLKLMLAEKKHA